MSLLPQHHSPVKGIAGGGKLTFQTPAVLPLFRIKSCADDGEYFLQGEYGVDAFGELLAVVEFCRRDKNEKYDIINIRGSESKGSEQSGACTLGAGAEARQKKIWLIIRQKSK